MTTPQEAQAIQSEANNNVIAAPWLVQKMIGAKGRRIARTNLRYWQNQPADSQPLKDWASIYDREPENAGVAIPKPFGVEPEPGSKWIWAAGGHSIPYVVMCVAKEFGIKEANPVVVFCQFADGYMHYLPLDKFIDGRFIPTTEELE